MSALDAWLLSPALAAREADGLYRQRQTIEGVDGPTLRVAGEALLAFCSNDYLGLTQHPDVITAGQRAMAEFGAGAGASHLISGHFHVHHVLEERLAEVTGRDRALLFSSGYQANIGLLSALAGRGDHIFHDRLNHASLLDGGLLSGARFRRFAHADVSALERLLKKNIAGRKLVVTDGVFSMDGDIAPLVEMARLCTAKDALLIVDDAHGFGVLGESGAGTVAELGLDQKQVPVLMGTLGKALGVQGAFVAGSAELIETLIQRARSYVYSTAIPPSSAAALLAGLTLLQGNRSLTEKLRRNIRHFRQGAEALALPIAASTTAIQPLLLGDSERAMRWSQALREDGLLVPAIRPPTVPEGSARLRIALSAAHSDTQINRLLDSLAAIAAQEHPDSQVESVSHREDRHG